MALQEPLPKEPKQRFSPGLDRGNPLERQAYCALVTNDWSSARALEAGYYLEHDGSLGTLRAVCGRLAPRYWEFCPPPAMLPPGG